MAEARRVLGRPARRDDPLRLGRALLAAGLIAALTTRATEAATMDGVTFPDSVQEGGRTLLLNGMHVRTLTWLRIRAYAVGLYVEQRSHDAAAILASPRPKVLMLEFLHDASKSRVEDSLRDGEQRTCAARPCSERERADFGRLIAMFPAASRGTLARFLIGPRALRVWLNGQLLSEIADPGVSEGFLESFIGPNPPTAGVRSGLLGLPAD